MGRGALTCSLVAPESLWSQQVGTALKLFTRSDNSLAALCRKKKLRLPDLQAGRAVYRGWSEEVVSVCPFSTGRDHLGFIVFGSQEPHFLFCKMRKPPLAGKVLSSASQLVSSGLSNWRKTGR